MVIDRIVATFKAAKDRIERRQLMLLFGMVLAVLAFAAIFGGLFVYLLYDRSVNGPKAAATQRAMEEEFKVIERLPSSVEIRYNSMHKTHQGDVGGDYKTNKSYEEIRDYYDSVLKKHGWRFVKEERVTSWGRDYGGKELFYCKGIYTATVQYSGQEESQVGWTYSFGLSWGLFDECNRLSTVTLPLNQPLVMGDLRILRAIHTTATVGG